MEQNTGITSTTVQIGRDQYRTEIRSGENMIIADEPEELGGTNLGLNPNELFLASLGSCTAITLRMYADRKEWNVDKISVDLQLDVVKSTSSQTTYIKKHIKIDGDITDAERKRMLTIADHCPVHKMMTETTVITSNLVF